MTFNFQANASVIAEIIVNAADRCLLPRFSQVTREYKADGSIVTAADLDMQSQMHEHLQQHFPTIGFLGEEMSAETQLEQLNAGGDGVWCLDPLDGTSNFAAGVPYFSVSLALLIGGEVIAGWVYDPVRREMFIAARGKGAWLNGEKLQIPARDLKLKQCLGLIDFKRLAPELATRLVVQSPYSSQRSFGSVALDWCWIATQRCQIYLHGKQKIWDYAAGWLVLREAGGYSCTLSGEPVFENSLQPRSAVAAGQKALFDQWYQWLSAK